MDSDAPCRVMTSAPLFRLITSFQRGVPSGIFLFWCAHAETASKPAAQRRHAFVKQLKHLPDFVAEHGDLRLLALLQYITISFPRRRLSRVCRVAARKNDAAMLAGAINLRFLHDADVLIVSSLLQSYEIGDFRALTVIQTQSSLLAAVHPRFLASANLYADLKDVAVIEWLRTYLPQLEWKWSRVVEAAATHGRMEVVRYAYAHGDSIKWHGSILLNQLHPTPGYWDCVRFLLHNHARDMTGYKMTEILTRASVEMFTLLSGFEFVGASVAQAVKLAAEMHQIDVLERFESVGWLTQDNLVDITRLPMNNVVLYLVERRLAVVTDDAMDRAALAKRWDIVCCLHDNYAARCTTRTMDAAIEQRQFDQVQFLHKHRTEGCSPDALKRAAIAGDLALVQYLTEVIKAPCTTAAMNGAASLGHVAVVRYLHTHRTEGCTVLAMDNAASNDRLDMVRFLHENRTEGCSRYAVKAALAGGYRQVLQYLFTHYRHHFDSEFLRLILLRGEFEIWETLRKEYPAEAEDSIAWAMEAAGKYYELPTIRYIVHTLGRGDLAYLAMARASQCKALAWWAAVWRATGPQSCSMAAVRYAIDRYHPRRKHRRIVFLVDNCVEAGAKELAIQYASDTEKAVVTKKLQRGWTPTPAASVELDPWLVDERTPWWVAHRLCEPGYNDDPWYRRVTSTSVTWPIQAVYRHERSVLEIALDDIRSRTDPKFSFEGARAAAVRVGDLSTLKWLLEHVDTVPVEPTLLDEALFYHRYEIAVWLATHCREACTAIEQPHVRTKEGRYQDCGYDAGLRRWLEGEETVRSLIDVDALPWETGGWAALYESAINA